MIAVCLHNVVAGEPDAFDRRCSRVSAADLEDFLDRAARLWELVPYTEFMRRLEAGRLAERALALTFDDGFRGVWEHAFPALARRGLDAGVFVNPPQLGRAPLFHFLELELAFRLTSRASVETEFLAGPLDLSTTEARVKAMKRAKRRLKTMPEAERVRQHARLLAALGVTEAELSRRAAADPGRYAAMDRAQLLALRAAGWRVGSHTLTHRALGWLEPEDLREEIHGARRLLDEALGEGHADFAYPYGEPVHIGPLAPAVCRAAGYRWAFTTVPGSVAPVCDPMLLRRVDYKDFRRELL